jgi:sarcosine oxidase subunit beta
MVPAGMLIEERADPPRTTDLVVIGGGVVGAATAFHAARAGLHPLIVEARPALCGLTTAASAGGFRLQLDDGEEYRLIRRSVDLFLNFEEVTGQGTYDPRVRQQGYLWLTTHQERAEQQRRLVETQRGWGLTDVEVISSDDVRRAFPFVSPEVIQARFRQGDGLLDPKALTFGLAAGSRAPIVTGRPVVGLRVDGQGVAAVETTGGAIQTRAVIVAAGPLSGKVASFAGVELPVTTVRRQKVVMPDVPEVPPHAPMTIDEDSGVHWRPAFSGAFLLFTDPATAPSPPQEVVPTDPSFAYRLLDPSSPQAVARTVPFWQRVWERGDAHWLLQAGQYTMTPDRRPLIGPTTVQGLFVNTGYSGRGVMGGPAGSSHLVDVITGRILPEANPFRLDRPLEARPHLDPL